MKTRTRYAPSPTGKLHIGGARTALFNYLIAKHENGDFIIRTEDTDIERNIDDGELSQIKNLEWLGIISDENAIKGGEFGPYRQTERIDIYNKYIDFLLEKGFAYECWCNTEELNIFKEQQKKKGILSPKYSGKCLKDPKPIKNVKPSIRIKVPKDISFTWNDSVRGIITIPGKDIGDWVIRKSNGIPTYNFAVVIDDHLMKITNVIRGEEHISNTPKQIHLFNIFGWDIPEYSHLSVIIGKDKKKLSKRDESTIQFIEIFRKDGFLPEAIFNFLALLGWSPIDEEEIFSKEKLIKIFDKERLSKAPSFFDINKLLWTNNQYIKNLNEKDLFSFLSPFIKDTKLSLEQRKEIFKAFQPQLKKGAEIKELIKLFTDTFIIEKKLRDFAMTQIEMLKEFTNRLKLLQTWNQINIKEIMIKTGEYMEVKGKKLMMPIRISSTGKEHGPDISIVLKIFGKEKTIMRLEEFMNEK